MTNREMLFKIQGVEPLISHIKKRAEIIITTTFDHYIHSVTDIEVSDTYVKIFYIYCNDFYSEWGIDNVKIPIEWFDEGFDYQSAYYKELPYPTIKKGSNEND